MLVYVSLTLYKHNGISDAQKAALLYCSINYRT